MLEAYLASERLSSHLEPDAAFTVEHPDFQTFAAGWTTGRHELFKFYVDQLKAGRSAHDLLRAAPALDHLSAYDRHRGSTGAHAQAHHRDALDAWAAGWSAGVVDLRVEQLTELDKGEWPAEKIILGEPVEVMSGTVALIGEAGPEKIVPIRRRRS